MNLDKAKNEASAAILECVMMLIGWSLTFAGILVFIGTQHGPVALAESLALTGLLILFSAMRKCNRHIAAADEELEIANKELEDRERSMAEDRFDNEQK